MSPIPGNNRQDPHNPDDEDISFAAMDMNIIMAGSSSDSAGEEDDNEYAGYQALPQEPGDDNDDDFTMESEGAMGGDHSDTTDHSIPEEELGNKHIPSYLQVTKMFKIIFIYIIIMYYILGLCLQINDSGLFARAVKYLCINIAICSSDCFVSDLFYCFNRYKVCSHVSDMRQYM